MEAVAEIGSPSTAAIRPSRPKTGQSATGPEAAIANLDAGTSWVVFDAGAAAQLDSSAAAMLDDVYTFAEQHGVKFAIVELHSEPRDILVRSGVAARVGSQMIFDDLEDAVAAYSASENELLSRQQ